ncbi:polyketide cyclase [Caulobacter sp. Root487D2Y]|uniref:polyketide cyclase n=1 Tax=Caulobacter sp. Root487D2Y TaxID=1736547 RepID=UPI0006FDA30D|nr:polyketide cyclase [Caulobacter sp. Root487D2Y]KQY29606.1 polyketide cyclase [Caulobacter sp. Root487D2Y]
MTLFETRPITVSIARPAAEVYAFARRPESFPKWAAGLGAGLTRDGDRWIAHGPDGDVQVRFSPENVHGVLDHWVTLPDGTELSIPLRVVANGDGAEVTLTLFRPPGMDDAAFERDQGMVAQDLARLKALLEA